VVGFCISGDETSGSATAQLVFEGSETSFCLCQHCASRIKKLICLLCTVTGTKNLLRDSLYELTLIVKKFSLLKQKNH